MSLTDKKVSDALLQTGVVSAPDRLTGTAAENKAVFDRLMRNVAQSVINPVIDELVGIEGADNIGTPGGSVRQRLDSASDHIGNRDNPHNVTPAQIGAETPMEAQNKVNEALSQAKQYAETEIRKHIAQSGAVIADGKGNAENANALNGVPGENYLPEKIADLTGAKSYEYAAPMACVARPSFIGRTVQEGTPSPDTPVPVKGVLNPWIKATAEDGTVVTKQLTGELFEGDSFDGVNLIANGTVSRHNLDLALSPGTYTIEAGDENGLLESASIEVLPDSAVYGRRFYPYQHIKEGTVHKLTGTSGAAQIIFNATDVYQDGDTWTLNGAAVSVTYNDGQALLPTAVIAGDVVEAAVEGDVLRLMLQKPTPQKPVNDNVYFDVWQRGTEFSRELMPGFLYIADRWWNSYQADSTYTRVLNTSPAPCKYALRVQQSGDIFSWNCTRQEIEAYERYLDCDLTVSFWIKPLGKIQKCDFEVLGNFYASYELTPSAWNLVVFTAKAGSYNTEVYKGLHVGTGLGSIQGDGYEITAFKLEIGDRYTGDYIAKPEEMLAECQRYLLMGPLQASRLSANHAFLSTPTAMRTTPSIVGSPGVYQISNEQQQTKATVSVHDMTRNGVTLNVIGATEPCFVYFPPGSGLSAEL